MKLSSRDAFAGFTQSRTKLNRSRCIEADAINYNGNRLGLLFRFLTSFSMRVSQVLVGQPVGIDYPKYGGRVGSVYRTVKSSSSNINSVLNINNFTSRRRPRRRPQNAATVFKQQIPRSRPRSAKTNYKNDISNNDTTITTPISLHSIMAATNTTPTQLSASYTSPTSAAFTLTQDLPAISPTAAPKDRAAYLAALRKATAQLQDQINAELTQRMEQDKAAEASAAAAAGKKLGAVVDESKEEDNYGEEVPEED